MATTAPVSTIVARKTSPKLPFPMICSALNCHCFPSMTSPTFGAAALAAAPSAPSPRRPFLCGCCRASWSTADEETSRRRLDSACLCVEGSVFLLSALASSSRDGGVRSGSRGRSRCPRGRAPPRGRSSNGRVSFSASSPGADASGFARRAGWERPNPSFALGWSMAGAESILSGVRARSGGRISGKANINLRKTLPLAGRRPSFHVSAALFTELAGAQRPADQRPGRCSRPAPRSRDTSRPTLWGMGVWEGA